MICLQELDTDYLLEHYLDRSIYKISLTIYCRNVLTGRIFELGNIFIPKSLPLTEYPERLNQEDYNKLQMWRDALQDLGNPFDMYGNRKSGEELQTALEIQAWNNWLQERTLYDVNYDAFDEEYQNIVDDIRELNNK